MGGVMSDDWELAQKRCSINGCDKPAKGTYCRMHATRIARHGSPFITKRNIGEPIKWLRAAIKDAGDDCVFWPFSAGQNGYGMLRFNRKRNRAHRVCCIIAHGEPPFPSAVAAHSCGNRLCVNPNHLRWATVKENVNDMIAHGTKLLGEKTNNNKLSTEQVLDIYSRAVKGRDRSDRGNWVALAAEYGVSHSTIWSIMSGNTWSHITGVKP